MADKTIEDSLKLLVEKAVKSFKEECNKKIEDLNTELLKVKRSQDFISTQYDKLNDEYFKLIETNKKQEAEIKKLKAESNVMSAQGPTEQWCRSLFSIGGDNLLFYPNFALFSTLVGMNLNHNFVQVWKFSEDQKKNANRILFLPDIR